MRGHHCGHERSSLRHLIVARGAVCGGISFNDDTTRAALGVPSTTTQLGLLYRGLPFNREGPTWNYCNHRARLELTRELHPQIRKVVPIPTSSHHHVTTSPRRHVSTSPCHHASSTSPCQHVTMSTRHHVTTLAARRPPSTAPDAVSFDHTDNWTLTEERWFGPSQAVLSRSQCSCRAPVSERKMIHSLQSTRKQAPPVRHTADQQRAP
jgi:hypothetical protein